MQVYEIIRSEEGLDRGHVQEVLENLSVEPVAAGSIGQVHSSTLHGSKVRSVAGPSVWRLHTCNGRAVQHGTATAGAIDAGAEYRRLQ